jgi:ribonuclease VapC
MVVDTSAILAILLDEQDGPELAEKISAARTRIMSPVSALEAGIVGSAKKGQLGGADVARLLETLGVTVVDFSADQAGIALDGWRRYGKGNHPAALNIADCCVYALCKTVDEPLLFKGSDFSQTDLKLVP